MPAVALGDIDMHYEERGAGPPLLLVPGIPAIGVAHLFFLERPRETLRLLDEFLL